MSIRHRNRDNRDTDDDGRTDSVDDRDGDGDRDGVRDGDRDERTAVLGRDRIDRDGDGVDDRDETAGRRRLRPDSVLARQRAEHSGVKVGAAFFGWLTALGTAVLLIGILSAIGVAVDLNSSTDLAGQADTINDQTLTIAGAVVVGVMLFLAYFAGGYVAGRMARFSGASQGFVVWLIGLVAAVAVGVLAAVAGDQYDLFANVNGFPSFNLGADATTAGVTAAAIAIFVTLGGAILGGLAGMRYHRKVDATPLVEPA